MWITRFVEFWIHLLSWKIWINLKSKCNGGTAHLCQKHMQKWFNLWLITYFFFRSCECIMPNLDISLNHKPKIMGKDWNPSNENMLQVGDDVNCDPGPCSSGRTPPINYLLQLCTLTKIKGRKFYTGKIASGRNYPTDRVLRWYYLRVGGIFVRLKSPESHHGDTYRHHFMSIAPENNKLSGKMQFKGKMMQFQFSFSTSFHVQLLGTKMKILFRSNKQEKKFWYLNYFLTLAGGNYSRLPLFSCSKKY